MIKAVKFVSIPVRDQDAALRFWTERCGFEIATDQPMSDEMGGQRWIELRIGSAPTRIVLFTPPGHESRIGAFMNLSFTCDDVQRTYDEMSSRGVVFDGPPETQGWGTAAIFADPDGNKFVLSSSR
ncbi:MAG TPA: VOC family protein [Candidatus Elarobacter sp.]|nr:VOC family protein [Candidatus Elarobacter sp.]